MPSTRRCVVEFDRAALVAIARESQRAYPLETGGILMGVRSADGRRVRVCAVIGPGPRATHEVDAFAPDQRWQEREVARVYETSGRITIYLGDWHTHPDGLPRPSRRDESTAFTIASAPAARAPRPIMAIVSVRRTGSMRLAAFDFRDGRLVAAFVANRRRPAPRRQAID
jgi:integrative and conjugative element protein (TIGR02256 family)